MKVETEFLLLIYQLQMIEESVLMSLKNIIVDEKGQILNNAVMLEEAILVD